MKVLRLQSENVKRLHAVDITPEGSLIMVGGANAAGKSSVLDSVAYALGGQSLIPSEPIRNGETEAKIVVDLGDYVVTRRFKRDHAPADAIIVNGVAKDKDGNVVPITWGPTSSSLIVTNRDGAKYPTPQALLDKLLGKLTFDPLAFAHANAKEQSVILRKLVGIDTTALDDARKTAVALRADLNRQFKTQQALLNAAKLYPDTPSEEIPLSEATAALQQAETLRRAANVAVSSTLQARQVIDTLQQQHDRVMGQIAEWDRQIAEMREKLCGIEAQYTIANEELTIRKTDQAAAEAAVPDIAATQARIAEIDNTNQKVRANKLHANIEADTKRLEAAVEEQNVEILAVDMKKAMMLQETKFPVPGLGLSDDGVTFNNNPFEQAATSEQIRTSVAIGFALNPSIKVLCVRDGNLLDDEYIKEIGEQAAAAEAQVWLEYRTRDAGQVSVLIEDGHQV